MELIYKSNIGIIKCHVDLKMLKSICYAISKSPLSHVFLVWKQNFSSSLRCVIPLKTFVAKKCFTLKELT